MRRFREIEAGLLPPAPDRLWLRLDGGRYRLMASLGGEWREVSSAGGSSQGGGLTAEERAELEASIAAAVAKADAAGREAAAARDDARAYADGLVSGLTDGAPEALDTMRELADKALALEAALDGLELTADKVSLETSDENLSSAGSVKEALERIAAKVWYTKISVKSLTATPEAGTFEEGATVAAPTLTWVASRTPAKTVVDGKALADPSATTYTLPSDLTASKTVTLTVTDEQGGTASASKAWTFCKALYQGMAEAAGAYDEEWIKTTLGGKRLASSAKGSYTMKASPTKYWHIAAPSAWTLTFTTAVGDGGASRVGEVSGFVNDEGKAVPMTVYRADERQGSDYTITVK